MHVDDEIEKNLTTANSTATKTKSIRLLLHAQIISTALTCRAGLSSLLETSTFALKKTFHLVSSLLTKLQLKLPLVENRRKCPCPPIYFCTMRQPVYENLLGSTFLYRFGRHKKTEYQKALLDMYKTYGPLVKVGLPPQDNTGSSHVFSCRHTGGRVIVCSADSYIERRTRSRISVVMTKGMNLQIK